MFGKKIGQMAAAQPISFTPIEFDVSPSLGRSLLGIGFFGAGALACVGEMFEDRGLIIDHIITLDPFGAKFFFGVLVVLCLGFVTLAIVSLIRSLGEKVWITLGRDWIEGPRNYNSNQSVLIHYRRIERVKTMSVNGNKFLEIVSMDGAKIKVGEANFREIGEWPRFVGELNQMIAKHR
jgi:hypothetical protein